jgi:hypothetical protein
MIIMIDPYFPPHELSSVTGRKALLFIQRTNGAVEFTSACDTLILARFLHVWLHHRHSFRNGNRANNALSNPCVFKKRFQRILDAPSRTPSKEGASADSGPIPGAAKSPSQAPSPSASPALSPPGPSRSNSASVRSITTAFSRPCQTIPSFGEFPQLFDGSGTIGNFPV